MSEIFVACTLHETTLGGNIEAGFRNFPLLFTLVSNLPTVGTTILFISKLYFSKAGQIVPPFQPSPRQRKLLFEVIPHAARSSKVIKEKGLIR